jgi:hypothetical protein
VLQGFVSCLPSPSLLIITLASVWHMYCLQLQYKMLIQKNKNKKLPLKNTIIKSPAIHAINYSSHWTVHLSVDTSYITIHYVLAQQMPDSDTKCYLSHFSSMLLNECKANYSQPKLKIYGLFSLWGLAEIKGRDILNKTWIVL